MYRALVMSSTFLVLLWGCSSRPDSDDKPKPAAESQPSPASPGEVRLTPEQIKINQIQVAPVTEAAISPAVSAIGRVRPRSGGEAEVFPPFAGRLLTDKPLPKPGDFVKKGDVIGEVEQHADQLVHQERGRGQDQVAVVAQRRVTLEAAADLLAAVGQGLSQQGQHCRPRRLLLSTARPGPGMTSTKATCTPRDIPASRSCRRLSPRPRRPPAPLRRGTDCTWPVSPASV